MRHELQDKRVKFFIGDVRDDQSARFAVRDVNLIFHAAALKQVPSGEFFPMEVVKTNVLGSRRIMELAGEARAEAMVCLSTDKAVYPINAMGMTKALMEKNALAMAREGAGSGTRFIVTRYGNVMNSRGSVIPKFVGQVTSGKGPTVTNPRMTRFLMSLEESVELVEHAFANGTSGDILVKKAPATTLLTLAEAILELLDSKLQPAVIGTRHGEKLYESLLSSEERAVAEDTGAYFRVPLDSRDLNYSLFFDEGRGSLEDPEPYTSHNTERLALEETKKLLLSLPEIQQWESN
jgi:UDP-glucose 4-epimerase